MSLPTILRAGILCGVTSGAIAVAAPATAQHLAGSIMVSGTPQTVWSWSDSTMCGGGNDFPDVPARPFLVGNNVLWFASNSGVYASVGTGGQDILATLQRGLSPGSPPSCVKWVTTTPRQASPPYYPGSVPSNYNTVLWMAAPFNDGTIVHALIHNEFHGDWTGSSTWCPIQTQTLYLPCSYWNIVTANSGDGAMTFQLNQASAGVNVPAIALANPYVVPPANAPTTAGPQGMTAQSNILQSGDYYYALALQLQAPGAAEPSLNSTCIWRAPVSTGSLVWTGWDGSAWTIAAPAGYPTTSHSTSPPLCKPVLPAFFRFSWSFNRFAGGSGLVVTGLDTLANLKNKNVSTQGCPYAPGASASTADEAFVYIVASQLPVDPPFTKLTIGFLQENTELCLLQINSMNASSSLTRQAYPSLLDPTSPQLLPGDLNFQATGQLPYLYFTQMNPVGPANPYGRNRDLVRMGVRVIPNLRTDTHDFNLDGISDIAWRDTGGDTAVWLMNGATVLSSGVIGAVPTAWSIVGQRDFDGDGMNDLLWRDSSGNTAIWFMNGTSFASSADVGNIPTTWTVVGTGDFNGDGFGDILWQDNGGDLAVWLMNGATVSSSGAIGNVPPATWSVGGIGDFNGDGDSDILWRDTSGNTSIWFMNGMVVTSAVAVGNIPTTWSVVGTGDFNGDGMSDIVWRDTSGNTAIWLMNGTTVSSSGSLGNIPTTWSIALTGDYNGDGHTDLLWRDTSGNTSMWFMNGTTVSSAGNVGNISANWTVQSVNAE
jgi:FG-GAP-like repeat